MSIYEVCCIELVHKLHLLLTSCSPKFRKRICPREAVFRTKVHLTYPSIEACKGNNEHLEHFCFLYKELPVCKIYLPIVVYTIIIFEPKFLLLFINAFKEKQRISYRSFKKLLSKRAQCDLSLTNPFERGCFWFLMKKGQKIKKVRNNLWRGYQNWYNSVC